MATLTTANSVFMLGVASLYNVPVKIEGFTTDDSFAVEDVTNAEVMMGLDGKMSAGYTPYPTVLPVTLQADSASNLIFDTLLQAEKLAREKYELNGTILIPSINRIFTFTRGFMTKASPMPANKKILQPRKFELTFQDMAWAPV
ncbi:MAG: phage tail fiber protein [Candidatus Binatia bacterium]